MADCRLGLIGAGRWGRNYIRTIEELPGVTLGRIASNNPETGKLAPAGCQIEVDWRAVASAMDLDGVIITTPPALHAEMTSAAVRAGLPVLVEKPLTMDLDQAEALGHLVARHDGYVLVDHTQLFNPPFAAMKRVAGLLGPVKAINSLAGNRGPFREGVNVLWDWGAHDVAMCLDFLDELPRAVTVRRIGPAQQSGESLELRLNFRSDVKATIKISNVRSEKVRRFAVQFQNSELVFDDFAERKLSIKHRHKAEIHVDPDLEYAAELPLTAVVREFIEGIRLDKTEADSLKLGIEVVKTLADCQKMLERLA